MTSIPTASSTSSSAIMVPLISPAKNLTESEFKKKFADWNKSINEAATELNATTNDQKKRNKAQQRYQKHYNAQRIHEGRQNRLRMAVPAKVIRAGASSSA